jgi:V/A-type H+-transporting ATPase subunit D
MPTPGRDEVARLALNKSSLSEQGKRLRIYERHLPSLDLKRRQLIAERSRARKALQETRERIDAQGTSIARDLPMLSSDAVDPSGLVDIERVSIQKENVVGITLPRLHEVEIVRRPISLLTQPAWLDVLIERLASMLELRILGEVQGQRLERLEEAVQTITQRVNLFDKVLIPRTREHIRRIRIHLSDAERAAVVAGKIAKRKRAGGEAP